jgi:hypothetical protein
MKQITEKNEQGLSDKDRRAFVTKTTVIGASIAGAVVLPGVAVASANELKVESKKRQKGYQLTDHVADYYQSASN